MNKISRILSFILVSIIVITTFSTTSYAATSKLIDLSDWQSVNITKSSDRQADWKFDSTKTTVTQTVNGRPSAFISNIECNNTKIEGDFSVNTTEDDDYIGFIFGYKDIGHYYLFDWKQTNQNMPNLGIAKQGMNVKLVNTNDSIEDKDLWKTLNSNNKVKSLYHNNIGYEDNTVYNFNLNFTGEGSFNIVIKEGDKVLDSITINDSTFTSGKFGFYNYSQDMVTYKGFTKEELGPILKVNGEDSKVNLTWNAVTDATSYTIKRSTTAGGPYTTIATDITDTTYTDTDVGNGTTYYYVVTSTVNGSESENSNEASATPTGTDGPGDTTTPGDPTDQGNTSNTNDTDNKLKVVLEVGEKLQLSVDDDLDENADMSWTSSDTSVATVNGNGVVTALAPGNTKITVTSEDGTYTDYINVLVVEDADDYRLAVDLKVGQTSRLTIDDLTDTVKVKWVSMDSSIAKVSSKGKVKAVSEGLALVTALDKDGNIIGKVYVRVRE